MTVIGRDGAGARRMFATVHAGREAAFGGDKTMRKDQSRKEELINAAHIFGEDFNKSVNPGRESRGGGEVKKRTSLASVCSVFVVLCSSPALADIVSLSFAGRVDISGARLGGVNAPLGSPFTLDIDIDDSMASTGRYAVHSISFTLTLGTYNTVTNWNGIVELVATPVGGSIALVSDPSFASPDEHFLLVLGGFGTSSIFDPFSWGGPAPLSGDIIVRGVGGFSSPDMLSGSAPYTGTLSLTVVPGPSSLALLGLGGLVATRRRR